MKLNLFKPFYLSLAIALFTIHVTGCSSNAQRAIPTDVLTQEKLIQQKLAFEMAATQNHRLQRLSFPLLRAAVDICGDRVTPKLGVQLHTKGDYPTDQQDAAASAFGALDGIRVKDTTPGSPAETALRSGDRLVSINHEKVKDSSQEAAQQLLTALRQNLTVQANIERDNTEITVILTAVTVCDYPAILSRRDAINAFADGDTIIVNEGLMRFAEEDSALALIVAHELAHNVIDHRADKVRGGLIGGLFDIAVSLSGNVISPGIGVGVGSNLFSQEYEVEADILAVRLMHKAGYPIQPLPDFWRKLAAVHPSSIYHGQQASHPTTVERYLIMKQEVERLMSAEVDDGKSN